MSNTHVTAHPSAADIESPYAWLRLVTSLALMTIGGSGMYSVSLVLPRIQAEFGIARADASLPYTLTMIGFGLGGIMMGRLADRFGVVLPVALGAVGLGAGFITAGLAPNIWLFGAAQGVLIGLLGTSATFAPLVADTSQWFARRRGIALAICMSGNYVAGALWPPVMQYFIERAGWRSTYVGMGLFCLATILPLAVLLRRRPPSHGVTGVAAGGTHLIERERPMGLRPPAAIVLLSLAGVSCCVAMSMPQVHIVAYSGDLGIGPARGAQMLSLMLGLGIVSRLASGWISDRIGGLRTLLLGSTLQTVALTLFLPFKGVVSLYVVSGLFGLFQGGIVPSYALIVREHFSPAQAGARMGTVLMATLFGMALGGWLSGAVFDWTGSYRAAFINGIGWNLLNLSIAGFLLFRVAVQARSRARGRYSPQT